METDPNLLTNLPENGDLNKVDRLLNPENERVQVVSVEDLIPEIKPREGRVGDPPGYSFDDSYAEAFIGGPLKMLTRDRKAFETLRQRLKDQVVVDLGSGPLSYGYFISLIFGCKAYVGVDKFYAQRLKDNLDSKSTGFSARKHFNDFCSSSFNRNDPTNENCLFGKDSHPRFGVAKPELELIPVAIEQEGALEFLKRLPDGSISVFTFGLDSDVITDGKYKEEISKEIQRVLDKNGLYLSYESGIPHGGLKNLLVENRWGGTTGKKGEIFAGKRASVLVKE